MVARTVGPCPEVVVHFGSVPVRCLLDTGSEVTLITESFFRQHLLPEGLTISEAPWLRITAANGQEVPYLGYLEMDISLPGIHLPGMGVLVVRDSPDPSQRERKELVPGLLGCNIIKPVIDILQAQSNTDLLNRLDREADGHEWAEVLLLLCKNTPERGSTNEITGNGPNSRIGLARVAGRKPVLIPANYACMVSCTGRKHPKGLEVLVQGIGQEFNHLPRGIHIQDSASKLENGKLLVCVANFSSEDKWLPPRTIVGEIHQVEVVDGHLEDLCRVSVTSNEIILGDVRTEASASEAKPTSESDLMSSEELFSKLDLDPSELTSAQLSRLQELLKKHLHVFSSGDDDLGYTTSAKHGIDLTGDDRPIRVPHRRVPPHLQQEVKEHLEKWLKQGIIRESKSAWAFQSVLVRKKDGKLRLCIDYRPLNKITHKDAYPLPRIDEALEALKGARFFSSLDLAQGYLQCAMKEEDINKTAFRVGSGGLYEFLRMPFGLCNAPATFQRLMENILGDQAYIILLLYLDDILVYASTIDEMLERLDLVFTRLGEHGLKIKPDKCHLFNKETAYLGHVVSEQGIATDPEKIRTVLEWPVPKSETELRSFLGLAGYYRRFVEGFSKIAAPLHALLGPTSKRKRTKQQRMGPMAQPFVPFKEKWTPECDTAFQRLKEMLTSPPVLAYPDFTKPFVVETDASLHGLGAVLSQDHDGRRRVICYASRGLRPGERNFDNYSSTKLELLALKWAVTEKFREYLLGSRFIILTDNNPLSYLMTKSKLSAFEMGWVA